MIFETFARRKYLASREGEPEVYTYDNAPEQLRHQICMTFSEGIGRYYIFRGYEMTSIPNANRAWERIDNVCRKEIFSYAREAVGTDYCAKFCDYLTRVAEIDDFVSAVEVGCVALGALGSAAPETRGAEQDATESINEINYRFEQHGVGYQFENRRIIRVDSKLVHAEVIKPALQLLAQPIFSKASEEFFVAHRHYRSCEYKDCVTAANRAFECMLKAICDAKKWTYGKGDRASELVTVVTNNGLFTHDFDKSLSAYVAMLKAGLVAVRNEAGGHGEGITSAGVTAEIARFALNLTASNILFLGESYRAPKKR